MKNTRRNSLLVGSLIILIIIFSPYLLYIYQSFEPSVTGIETIFGTIEGGLYESIQLLFYYFFAKLVPIILLIVWFVTCKHWWVHALIIPISVYFFQLIGVIRDSFEGVDESEFIYSVPITVIVFVILYFIRSKMAIYITAVDLKKEMDEKMKVQRKVE